ncbi:DUF721 domain-containing protein [Patescibacteria group bacterium]|nr:DUF721 domain-containing protein [Patescibacteria group bacterium]MBP9709949.1 DUF721 domain-containing protein [Patescibacteria group bacterium]
MSLEPIRRFLPRAIQTAGIAEQVTAARVLFEAKQSLVRLWGEEKAAYVEMVSFAEGTLKIASRAGAALQELKMQTVRFQNDVNRVLGGKVVKKILLVNK